MSAARKTAANRAARDLDADILEHEAEKARARRFFWFWFGFAVVVALGCNALVPWRTYLDNRIVWTVTTLTPLALAILASVGKSILASVGVESRSVVAEVWLLWGLSLSLTLENAYLIARYGVTGVSDAPHVWSAFVFPLTVDIPILITMQCVRALKPISKREVRERKREVVEQLSAKVEPIPAPTPTPTPTPTPKIVAKVEPETKTEIVATVEPIREPIREVVRELSANSDVLERAQALVDADKTSCSLEETAAVLSALDSGDGASSIARDTGIPRGRILRIRDAERGLVAV